MRLERRLWQDSDGDRLDPEVAAVLAADSNMPEVSAEQLEQARKRVAAAIASEAETIRENAAEAPRRSFIGWLLRFAGGR